MHQRIGICFLISALPLTGCSKSPPILAGGQPPSHWVEALNDPDPRNRKRAAHHLGNAGAVDGTIVPALMVAIKDPDPTVRTEVAVALMKIGPAAKAAIGVLTEAKEDANAGVRGAAAKALERIRNGRN